MKFRKLTSSKHVDLRQIENFVRSKYFPKHLSKDKAKKANLKFCENCKIVDGHLTYKEKRRVIFGMVENFKYHNTTQSYCNPILIYDVWISNKVSRLSALT